MWERGDRANRTEDVSGDEGWGRGEGVSSVAVLGAGGVRELTSARRPREQLPPEDMADKSPQGGSVRASLKTARKPVWPKQSEWGRTGKMSQRVWQKQIG